ncbi:hypothetical protein PM001_07550 [[Clostridium] symbiosum]|uniref:hypothetical protein n=1 Tax=Clostridium symbiosum TaxID=1512 RepID=UPI00232F6690|nr:hypothetical protein [[Clostridium] symbiosum]MDB2035956.1 hypothetical protein [[Clostridium] symbiosum]
MVKIKNDKGNKDTAIRIKSIQANNLLRKNNGDQDAFLGAGNAMINNSLFAEYMRKHGVTVNTRNFSYDFIIMKFDFGIKGDENIPKMTENELRHYFYENGATVTWESYDKEGNIIEGKTKQIHYKMLMRSTGKAKEGACIFICEKLHKKALDYITMKLYDKMPFNNANIVGLSAYSTLITATAIDYISIPLANIFVAKDESVSTMKQALTVKVEKVQEIKQKLDYSETESYINQFNLTFYKMKQKNDPNLKQIRKTKAALIEKGIEIEECPVKEEIEYVERCYVERKDEESAIVNTLWDGMGLIDDSIFPDDMDGFIYCRSHFFKSCLFRGNIQQYFKDYYGDKFDHAVVTDMLGREIKVSDIKVVITENSLKWMKFVDLMGGTCESAFMYYNKFMKKHGERFAIVKTGHSSKWGELQRSSYQMNGSLPTTDEDILKEVAKVSIDYCSNLKLDHNAFREHLKITGTSKYSFNNVLLALDDWNEDFKRTKYFNDKKVDIISRFKKERLQLGKLLQYGDNLTICGNLVSLLMKVVGKDFLQEECFESIEDGIQCYTSRFNEGERIAGFRSPHNSPNNIVHLINVYPPSIQKYFPKLGKNVIVINGIGTDVQSRLNGQDLDTDAIYATNQKQIVELARKAYKEYPTIINGIKSVDISSYNKSMESYAKMDNAISASQYAVGYASNIAQLALSYYYDGGGNDREIEDIFIICSVLAQVAIDSAKRYFEIEVEPELSKISHFACMKHKPQYPRFYAGVQKLKAKYSKRRRVEMLDSDIGDFNCPMDIIYRIIDKEVIDLRKNKNLIEETISLGTLVADAVDIENVDRKQRQKVISIVNDYSKVVGSVNREQKDYQNVREREFNACMMKLKNMTIKRNVMHSLIQYAFERENAKIRDNLLTVLFDKDQNIFLQYFKKTEKSPR